MHVPHSVLLEAIGGKASLETESIRVFVDGQCTVQPSRDDDLVRYLQLRLDAGESQAISWAKHFGCAVLIDEKMGCLMARAQGVSVFGVLGLLLLAKQAGQVSAVAPLIKLLQRNRYNSSDALVATVLQKAGEQ